MMAQISEDEFRLFRDFIHRECGLYFADNKRAFLSSRIGKRLAAKSIGSFYRYYRYLSERGQEQEDELHRLLDVLTINETAFFRNRPQFEMFESIVVPEIVNRKRALGQMKFRVWSAGCATGEEPYSIAVSLSEHPMAGRMDARIYASDLSLAALQTAARGLYPETKLSDVAPALLQKYFEKTEEGFQARAWLKKKVIFDFHNLKHQNGLGDLDVIFCRNVLIYFDPEEQRRVVERLVRALGPGGYLFLGHSESVQGAIAELKFVHHDRGTAYKKVSP